MRTLSFRDILLAVPHLKNEIEMINPKNDKEIHAVLEMVGFDIKHPILYIPSNHRDMKEKIAVGFVAVGEYNLDPKYNKFIDVTDRTILAGMKDVSLAKEMCQLMGTRFTYKNDDEAPARGLVEDARYYTEAELMALGFTGFEDDSEDSFLADHGGPESDCDMITSQVEALIAIRVSLRGE